MTPESISDNGKVEFIETIVIGGGQAGLTTGYHLARRGRPFVILDANERVGDAWRKRWDSLLLFTPARFNGLPGMRFPAARDRFITKDEMADYLESYAERMELPVRGGMTVDRLSKQGDRYIVSAGGQRFIADNVIVAMSNCQVPWIPAYSKELDARIVQLHSHEYRNPSQLQPGRVLVVGAGNSGADIAIEVIKSHPTYMAGKESAAIPFRIEPWFARNVLVSVVRFVGHHILSVRTPLGRKVRPKMLQMAAPLVRVKPKDLVAAGVERVSRITGVEGGLPVTEEGNVLEVDNVIWCTGFRPGFSWIDLPILGNRQEPAHESGVVPTYPGLFFVGLFFLHSATSETITGMQRDAKRIAGLVVSRAPKEERRQLQPA